MSVSIALPIDVVPAAAPSSANAPMICGHGKEAGCEELTIDTSAAQMGSRVAAQKLYAVMITIAAAATARNAPSVKSETLGILVAGTWLYVILELGRDAARCEPAPPPGPGSNCPKVAFDVPQQNFRRCSGHDEEDGRWPFKQKRVDLSAFSLVPEHAGLVATLPCQSSSFDGQPKRVIHLFSDGSLRVATVGDTGAGEGWSLWTLTLEPRAAESLGGNDATAALFDRLRGVLGPEDNIVHETDLNIDASNPVPPMLADQFGNNKAKVLRCTFRPPNECGLRRAKPNIPMLLVYFEPVRETGPEGLRRVEAQANEAYFATADNGEHIVRCHGCIFYEEGDPLYPGIKALVYESTTVEYVLQLVLVRKDIDVLSLLPFFTRQLLAALDILQRSRGEGAILRNLDPARVVIFHRSGDKTMAVRFMDLSSVCSARDSVATRRMLPWLTADRHAPEGNPAGFGSKITHYSDVYCLGLLVARALLASMHYGGELRWKFARFCEEGPGTLRRALLSVEVRMDNGLRKFALAALHPDPAHRPTASLALTMVHPGNPMHPISTGQLSTAALELPYNAVPDWTSETGNEGGDALYSGVHAFADEPTTVASTLSLFFGDGVHPAGR